ncbi:MAG: hypothetical protein M3O41_10555 [Pseudomonadota bacterium]|nr:hypothetical protein [Pseudomonadota bacterium]
MRKLRLQYGRRDLFTGLLLVVLLFRAYVPVGFMPASGAPFLLEPCPAVYQAPMPAHHGHHHSDTHAHFENCPFGSAPGAGPIAHIVAFAPPAPVVSQPILAFESLRLSVLLPRAHQPRGPPSPA